MREGGRERKTDREVEGREEVVMAVKEGRKMIDNKGRKNGEGIA